jgi:CubicO group peptidase (beta-lactamase class C family)
VADFVAWQGELLAGHLELFSKWYAQDYRLVSLSIYGDFFFQWYAAVMVKSEDPVPQRQFALLSINEWQQTFDEQAEQGFGPIILAAMGSSSAPFFAAVFEPREQIPLTRHQLTSGDLTDLSTIQGMNSSANSQGLILTWAASYGDPGDPRFAAIWNTNADNTLWNNDGLVDDPTDYSSRFNAQTSGWCRPAFVTVGTNNTYMSVFVANEVGPWAAAYDCNSSAYEAALENWGRQGYYPLWAQASGASPASARFAALFVQTGQTINKQFTSSGPIANLDIDQQVQSVMEAYPVARHASLAIVSGTKLVYARAYTLAEPDWPVVQPTTFFRLASVSKTVTALAIYQLIEENVLHTTDTLQDILQLRTPAGGYPSDPKFGEITIGQLLVHTSGLDTDGFSNGTAVVQAFADAGVAIDLPVTQSMTDSYIASQYLLYPPGTVQQYSNCGYYLLGRVVARLRGTNTPIDAYQQHLLAPLSISRIRSSVDLISQQLPDEARYQAAWIDKTAPSPLPDLTVAQSLMTPDQPLVPAGYGNYELAITQGAGGLSAATTDLARLIAIMMDPNDNPALHRSTISSMLKAGSALTAANQISGYGFDSVFSLGSDQYHGQKGGEIINAAGVFEFNGDWGFALFFGSPAQRPSLNPVWYPDFTVMMNKAKATSWSAGDLFPEFGMPSF